MSQLASALKALGEFCRDVCRAILDMIRAIGRAFVTTSEAAALRKVHRSTITRWVREGRIVALRGRRGYVLFRSQVAL